MMMTHIEIENISLILLDISLLFLLLLWENQLTSNLPATLAIFALTTFLSNPELKSGLTAKRRLWLNIRVDWSELIRPQNWATLVDQTSKLTDSSWWNLNIDQLELVKPKHWPTQVGETYSDRLRFFKPQHWPTRIGGASTLTGSG